MSRLAHPLDALIAGLRGLPFPDTDWERQIALANRTLLTPALFAALSASGQLDRVPPDAAEYLRFLHACNHERNLRLRAQLDEAVAALNDAGIVPVLLKGAVPLFRCPADRLPARITSDLDISVDAARLPDAFRSAEALGYIPIPGERGMARPQDVGMLELRETWEGRIEPDRVMRRDDGLRVIVPSANARAMHWIMHDLLKEGDYWRGRIDLRHLHDLWRLSNEELVDWAALRALTAKGSARNAIDTQLLTLHHLFGVQVPAVCARRPIAQLQHRRRLFTARNSTLGAPLRLAGNLAWGVWRLFQSGDMTRGGPARIAHRIRRTLLDGRSRI